MVELTYTVPGMTCVHCKYAVSSELSQVAGVDHRVALDAQQELLTAARERLGDGEVVLDVLFREERAAGRDLADERKPAS